VPAVRTNQEQIMLNLQITSRLDCFEDNELTRFWTDYDIAIKNAGEDERDFSAAGLPDPDEQDSSGEPQAHVGLGFAHRLHIALADNFHVKLFDICDSRDQLWHDLFCQFLTNGDADDEIGFFQPRAELRDCCTGDVLLVNFSLEPTYEQRGLEWPILDRIIDNLGAGCALAVYLLDSDQDPNWEWLKRMGFRLLGPFAYSNLTLVAPRAQLVGPMRYEMKGKPCSFE
jgi:hypothetical protein